MQSPVLFDVLPGPVAEPASDVLFKNRSDHILPPSSENMEEWNRAHRTEGQEKGRRGEGSPADSLCHYTKCLLDCFSVNHPPFPGMLVKGRVRPVFSERRVSAHPVKRLQQLHDVMVLVLLQNNRDFLQDEAEENLQSSRAAGQHSTAAQYTNGTLNEHRGYTRFFCRAVTRFWVSGHCTKWRIQGSFDSSYFTLVKRQNLAKKLNT